MYLSSLALVGLLGSALAVMHNPHRKTMGFGPVHPHAKFHVHEVPVVVPGSSCKLDDGTTPISSSFFNSNPYEIARCFVTALLDDQLSEDNSFALRNDSYTDKATGVTHVFFRQMINGIEVADGDINVNVMDGRVISYGDSFYRGDVPNIVNEPIAPVPPADSLQDQIVEHLSLRQFWQESVRTDQNTMSGSPKDEDLHRWNCEHLLTPYEHSKKGFAKSGDVADPRNALLHFMLCATPHDAVVQEILNNYDQIIENMTSSFGAHAIGSYVTMVGTIDNVPDAVSPVQAKSVYIQLLDGDKTMLMQAWRFEVEMRHNRYEAVVSRQAPYHILSVVDWVSD